MGTTKDVLFDVTPRSLELILKLETNEECILFEKGKKLNGLVDVENTLWTLSEKERTNEPNHTETKEKELTVTISKHIVVPSDPCEIFEFDWGCVYPDDTIVYKKYDKKEDLDVEDYASSLGIDINNINMSIVEKNMFMKEFNETKNKLGNLTKKVMTS